MSRAQKTEQSSGGGGPGTQSEDTKRQPWTPRGYYKRKGKRRVIIILTVVNMFGPIFKGKNKGGSRLTKLPFTLNVRTEVIMSPCHAHQSSQGTSMYCLKQNGSFFIEHENPRYVHKSWWPQAQRCSHILSLCFMKSPYPKPLHAYNSCSGTSHHGSIPAGRKGEAYASFFRMLPGSCIPRHYHN